VNFHRPPFIAAAIFAAYIGIRFQRQPSPPFRSTWGKEMSLQPGDHGPLSHALFIEKEGLTIAVNQYATGPPDMGT